MRFGGGRCLHVVMSLRECIIGACAQDTKLQALRARSPDSSEIAADEACITNWQANADCVCRTNQK